MEEGGAAWADGAAALVSLRCAFVALILPFSILHFWCFPLRPEMLALISKLLFTCRICINA